MRTRVAVVGGGQNCEHEVSLASAASVAAALDPAAYEVERLTIAEDGRWLHQGVEVGLAQGVRVLQSCAVVLPIVHGPRGEDGSLAALCELAGVPHVGSGVRAGALAMDKWATKLVAEAVGVATAPGCLLTRDAALDGRPWTGPVVVKPVAAGSSHGVTLVRTPAELLPALELAFSLDQRVLVEDLLVGREIDVAVLTLADGSRLVGPPLEIVVDADALFDTERKYDGSADFRLPADVDGVLHQELESAATTMYDALGCAGLARIDFFVTAEGLVLNEVNTMPGMTEQSQAPKMFAAAGMPYADLLDELVRGALAHKAPVVPFTV